MAHHIIVLALVFFAIVGMASATASSPESSISLGPATDNNIIGTVDGYTSGAAPAGGPVAEGTLSFSPAESPTSASTILQASTVAGAVASSLVASFFF